MSCDAGAAAELKAATCSVSDCKSKATTNQKQEWQIKNYNEQRASFQEVP
jgi:hypothetical protein